jgi:DNA repair exonuclease SbcCD ATPase subunit
VRIDRLILQEWHCFRRADADLSRVRVASVVGRLSTQPEKSNGAGKSYFIESIKYAIFGYDRDPESIQRLKAADHTFVELFFGHRGKKAHIKRGFRIKRDGSKGAAILEFEIDGQPQGGDKIDDIKAAIIEFVGCDLDTYSATCFFSQGSADQFVLTTPAQRAAILAGLLGLSLYEEARVVADRHAAVLEASLETVRRSEDLARLSLQAATGKIAELSAKDLSGTLAARDREIETLVALQGDYSTSVEGVRSFSEAISGLSRAVAAARTALSDAERSQRDAEAARVGAVQRRDSRRRALVEEYKARQETIREIPALEAASAVAASDLAAAEAAFAAAPVEDPAPWRVSENTGIAAVAEANAAMKAAEAVTRRIDTLGAVCPTCSQPVSDSHKEGHRKEAATAHAAAVEKRAAGLRQQEEARAQQKRIADLTTARTDASLRVAAKKPLVKTTADAVVKAKKIAADQAAAVDSAKIETEGLDAEIARTGGVATAAVEAVARARVVLQEAEEALLAARSGIDEGAEAALARLNSRIVTRYRDAKAARDGVVDEIRALRGAHERAEADKATLFDAEQKTRAARVEIETLRFLGKAFSKTGIPHLVAENVVAEIEKGTVEILQALESPNGIRFRTTTDTGRDTIQIEVETPDGVRGLKSFSGGQITEQNIAVRLALGEVLARRAEVTFESVFLDEVMAPLDAPARQCFLRVVNLMSRSFEQIFVISHHSEIRDVLESCIAVEWHPDGATVEVS